MYVDWILKRTPGFIGVFGHCVGHVSILSGANIAAYPAVRFGNHLGSLETWILRISLAGNMFCMSAYNGPSPVGRPISVSGPVGLGAVTGRAKTDHGSHFGTSETRMMDSNNSKYD